MFRLGIAQINNHFQYESNFASIVKAMRVHAQSGSDFVLFPECAVPGFNTGMRSIDLTGIISVVERVQEEARKLRLAIALPTPWPTVEGKYFNSVLIIGDDGKLKHRFDKIGLHTGEDRIFAPGVPQARVFEHRGFRMGVSICIEASHQPWAYFRKDDPMDCILWPGFWGVTPGVTWADSQEDCDQRVRQNLKYWRVPMVQATCASSPEAQHWPEKRFGGSLVLNSSGRALYSSKVGAEDYVVVDFDQDKCLAAISRVLT
jgi:predicted amidohydrolase